MDVQATSKGWVGIVDEYFARHLPSMVKTVPSVRKISRTDLRKMGLLRTCASMRERGQVLDALKKP